LEAAIEAYNSSELPGRYRLEESSPYWHIVPSAFRNAAGDVVAAASPFDSVISIEAGERTPKQTFLEVIAAVERASGHQILVGFSPFGRGDVAVLANELVQVSGREALRRLLTSLGRPYVWYLMKDPGGRRYGLSIVLL